MVRKFQSNYLWEDVDLLPYKETGNHFKSITRQILSHGVGEMPVELRYFEVAPGGHSTLEKHEHAHLVLILRGKGKVLVGEEISPIGEHDVVEINPRTWHQFHSEVDEALGFLCIVSKIRDKPQLPNLTDLEQLRQNSAIAEFIRV